MTRLHPDWRDFFASLLEHEVKFVIVGALAVAVHAEPRHSEDLDVFVEPSLENAERLGRALRSFGFDEVPTDAELAAADRILMLGRKPFRIDVLKSISGVEFAEAWRNRLAVAIDGLSVPVIGLRELVANKRAAGRDKDLRDVITLERYARPPARGTGRPSAEKKRTTTKERSRKKW